MSIYELDMPLLSEIFNIKYEILYVNDDNCEPINEEGWNNCKAHSISVSLGMKEMYETENGKKLRKQKAIQMRNNKKCISSGNKNNKHSDETKKIIGQRSRNRLNENQKREIIRLYDQHVGTKTIAKTIGCSQTTVRKIINLR